MDKPYVIPPETYATVLRLVTDFANATEAGDGVLRERAYDSLLDCCVTETAAGRGSGFIWEALADVTDDDGLRLEYYCKALEHGRANHEPVQTTLLEMGRIRWKRGDIRQALPLLEEARSIAITEDDDITEGAASALLLQWPDQK